MSDVSVASESAGEIVKIQIPGLHHRRVWCAPENLHFSQVPTCCCCCWSREHPWSSLALDFSTCQQKNALHSRFAQCVCQTVSLSPATLRGERGRCRQAPTHLFCVPCPPYRKQELANSSDVTLPDRSLSPPLTAPPTMKVRNLELVRGRESGWGKSQGLALYWHQTVPVGPTECLDTSGNSVPLSSPGQEENVTVRLRC